METKECRHCKQPIHKNARRCQHCQGMQGWISDQKDPRMWMLAFVPLVIVLVISFFVLRDVTEPLKRSELAPSSLSINNVSFRFGTGASSDKIFVYGDVSNSSSVDAGKTCLRINLWDKQNKLIDSFIQGTDGLIMPAKGTIRIRFVSETPVKPTEIKKAEITVERIRARGKWD